MGSAQRHLLFSLKRPERETFRFLRLPELGCCWFSRESEGLGGAGGGISEGSAGGLEADSDGASLVFFLLVSDFQKGIEEPPLPPLDRGPPEGAAVAAAVPSAIFGRQGAPHALPSGQGLHTSGMTGCASCGLLQGLSFPRQTSCCCCC